jgi:UDP-4-amino-4,6-dideoxy-N-acetyl-beta-L-altrosamine transaminase
VNSKIVLPYGKQDITPKDIEAVVNVLRSDFLTQGPVVPKFEQELCEYTKARYAVAVNSCTSALHVACLSLGLGPGDILWTSPITFAASANCALYCGASVDYIDIDYNTGLIDIDKLKRKLELSEKLGKLPKIVVPVHLAGQPCSMKEIYSLSKKYGFKIIEDAAHAIGSKYQGETTGNCRYSDITVFSFHPVKIITTGEGGVALTNNFNLARRMRLLRSHGITRDEDEMIGLNRESWYYEQIALGYNYRMTDIQAALGISQLERLDQYIVRRQEISCWYKNTLNSNKILPLEECKDVQSSWHLYIIRVKDGKTKRGELARSLLKLGIGVNLHYIPLYKHPYHKKDIKLLNSEKYYETALSIPIFPAITESSLEYISDKINLLAV